MCWDRKLWGIQFSSKGEAPVLIGGNWHKSMKPRYTGEPTRPILFTSRKLAREWCVEQLAKYKDRNDVCKYWRFRPVRVTEVVRLTQRALDGAFCACPIFIPSYESTAAKCRLCGKPPRQ